MVLSLVREAIDLKMKARTESPLISVYEFCYAAGLGLAHMGAAPSTLEELRGLETFLELKSRVQDLVRESSVWESFPYGERLKSLILGCRIDEPLNEDAWALFEMGLSSKF